MMKVRMSTAAIGRGLQAATTLGIISPLATETAQACAFIGSNGAGDQDTQPAAPLSILSPAHAEVLDTTSYPVALEWNSEHRNEFRRLADREALGTATPDELRRIETLAVIRRQEETKRTGGEVLREYEQQERVRDLLRSLTRYVEFINPSADQPRATRARSKTKA